MLKLSRLNEFPTALLTASAHEVADILTGPTLIHLPGRRVEPLFVSILLHGNEDVGLLAIQQVLREHHTQQLPRALSVFIGNVEAARHGVRRLDHQPDYNRVWPGSDTDGTAEHALMQSVVVEMRTKQVFASIDLHNNTGRNPHYGCVNRLDYTHLHLASLFSRTVVFFLRPHGVQSQAFSAFCPAVTCECGKVGDATGVTHAAEFVRSCLHLSEIPNHELPEGDVHVFRTVATAKVKSTVELGFADSVSAESADECSHDSPEHCDLVLRGDIEDLNFQELPIGSVIGQAQPGCDMPLQVWDQEGRDATHEYLELRDGAILLRRTVMPSMLTRLTTVIRQDCLGYFMERHACKM